MLSRINNTHLIIFLEGRITYPRGDKPIGTFISLNSSIISLSSSLDISGLFFIFGPILFLFFKYCSTTIFYALFILYG